ncbi:MAG: 1,4-alpha-glucan branching protein domain-containing protein [bacterium]
MEPGSLALVLHAHLPFVRHPEYEGALEEHWLYEALTESYIPLLLVLDRLVEDGIDFRLAFSLTPTLVSMLGDPLLQSRYLRRLELLIELAEKEIARTSRRSESRRFHALARMYHRRFREVRDAFLHRYRRNLVHPFGRLQRLGKIEIVASAATHGYLPLLSASSSAVRAQIGVGLQAYEQAFGIRPRGFWLPECGFYPGVDAILRDHKVRYTFLETHGLTRARPRPIHGVYAPIYCPSGVAAFGRDPESSKQVWSSTEGYPGDPDYREFYRDVAYDREPAYVRSYIHPTGARIDTGIKYFRITGRHDRKEVYVPERAEQRAELHARDFAGKRAEQIRLLSDAMDRKPLIVAPYDAELFGHWWYEGPLWLDRFIRLLASGQTGLRLVTPSEYLNEYPSNQVAAPAASSWGYKGFHEVWLNGTNDWIYRHLHHAAGCLQSLAARHPQAAGLTRRALNQALRELLLAQASDWAFMMKSGAVTDYAVRRTKSHLLRLARLCDEIDRGAIDRSRLLVAESRNNIFPHIEYRQLLDGPLESGASNAGGESDRGDRSPM